MTLGLANRCTWLQVYSVLVYFMVYHISKFHLALMYMQYMRMVYREFHRHHNLVLDQSVSDNAYSNPLRHEVWNVDQKIIMLGIGSCYNIFSNIFVQHQYYLEHDAVCLSILFLWIFFFGPDKRQHLCDALFPDVVGIT